MFFIINFDTTANEIKDKQKTNERQENGSLELSAGKFNAL